MWQTGNTLLASHTLQTSIMTDNTIVSGITIIAKRIIALPLSNELSLSPSWLRISGLDDALLIISFIDSC